MRNFKVGDKVKFTLNRIDYSGSIIEIREKGTVSYPILVDINDDSGIPVYFTWDGRYYPTEEPCLQHSEETFEIGDKVYHPDFGEGIIERKGLTEFLFISFTNIPTNQMFYPDGRFCKKGEITLRKLEKEG